jgi:hypothetical protein
MPRRLLFSLIALLFTLAACSSSSSTPPPLAVGDSCLVGSWILVSQSSHSTTLPTKTTKYSNLTLNGLKGATLTIAASGDSTFNYDSSAPAVGTNNSIPESLTLRGTSTARLHTTSSTLSITPLANHVTMSVTLKGVTAPTAPLPDPLPAIAAYTCTTVQLQLQVGGTSSYSSVYARSH